MTTADDFFAAGLEQVRKSWSWFLVLGISLIVLGVLCVGGAQSATTLSILVLGWILAISGVMWLVNAFRALSWHGFFLFLTEHDHPRGDWMPSAPSPGRGSSGRDLAARIPVYRGRIVPRSWSWRHALPQGGAGWRAPELCPLCLVFQYW
jgi:hypothetical protein